MKGETVEKGCLCFVISAILAGGATALTAAIGEYYMLPIINGWTMAHGTIVIVFPIYFCIVFAICAKGLRLFDPSRDGRNGQQRRQPPEAGRRDR